MRVIVLNDHGFVNGGAAQVAISSLNGLAKAGIDVTFVASVGPVDLTIDRTRVNVVDFGLHDLLGNPSRLQAAVQGIWSSACEIRLRKLLLDFDRKNTVIHLHSWVKSLSSSVVRVANNLGFKVVCTLHDYFAVCPNGGLYNFPRRQQCKLDPMSIECIACNCDSRSYTQKLWRVSRQLVQSRIGGIPSELRYFISVSEYSESLLRPLLPKTATFFQVRNPIDIQQDLPASVAQNNAFTFVGRLAPEKGADVFAEAALQAKVSAVFVGSGIGETRIAAINPLAELRGWQGRTEVVQAIRSSRAVVFPSLWHETYGIVVLEAAALGVPAIVSNQCAARDSIVDGETGLLFQTGSVNDLAQKLDLLNVDPQAAGRLGRNAYDRYWEDPSTPDSHVKQLIACYTRILDQPD